MKTSSKTPMKKKPKRNLFDDITDPFIFVLRELALPIPDTLIGMVKKKKKAKEVKVKKKAKWW